MSELELPPEPDRLDPIAILREELIAAGLAHGAERCEELADNVVERYAARIGGLTAYVRTKRAQERIRISAEILRRFNGTNLNELARDFEMSTRNVRYIIARAHKRQSKLQKS